MQKKNIIIITFTFFTIFYYLILSYLEKVGLHQSSSHKIIITIFKVFIPIFLLELIFRLTYRYIKGHSYYFIPKVPFKKMYIEPHPHIPFVYKKKFQSQKKIKSNYPLSEKNKPYYFDQLFSNNFRHNDGLNGSRDIIIPKPDNQYRILCLGASTTGNYINYNGKNYSYPMELEKYLNKRDQKIDYVVHNCGQGGWDSSDIMINFLLKLYDTEPDAIIIYHGYNDIKSYLTPNFESDYSHSKRNLGESILFYQLANYIPNIPLKVYNAAINTIFPFMNPRYGILEATSRNEPDYNLNFNGLGTYRRNIEHIIRICLTSKIKIVLSSYAHFLFPEIEESIIHNKHRKGVILENEEIKKIATKFNLPLIDNFKNIPYDSRHFVDSIHFTPIGMKFIAKAFGDEILSWGDEK